MTIKANPGHGCAVPSWGGAPAPERANETTARYPREARRPEPNAMGIDSPVRETEDRGGALSRWYLALRRWMY
jgi:hypothetical protein